MPESCLSAVNVGQLLHAADKPDVLATVTEKKLVGSCRREQIGCLRLHYVCSSRPLMSPCPLDISPLSPPKSPPTPCPPTPPPQVPQYILSRLPLLRGADDRTRKSKARVLALLAALLKLAGGGNSLRAPAEGGLEALARKLHVGKREVLEPLLELFYFKGWAEGGGEAGFDVPHERPGIDL